jgi:hypothetical protein
MPPLTRDWSRDFKKVIEKEGIMASVLDRVRMCHCHCMNSLLTGRSAHSQGVQNIFSRACGYPTGQLR